MHLPSSVAELHARLGKPADWWPLLGEEEAAFQECISLLRTTATKSGFHLVTPFRQRWQAKVSARGKQRSLGVFVRQLGGCCLGGAAFLYWAERATSLANEATQQERRRPAARQPAWHEERLCAPRRWQVARESGQSR